MTPYEKVRKFMRQGPDYIQFYPTLRCNRSCAFCFNQALPATEDMSASSFRRMLDRLPRTVQTLDIIGGEPTLHPEIVSLVRSARCAGLSVNVSSNGSSTQVLEAIVAAEPSVTIGISVNDRETLDALSGFIGRVKPVVKTVFGRDLNQDLVRDILQIGPKSFYAIYRDATGANDLAQTVSFPEFLEAAARIAPDAGTVYCSGFLPDLVSYPDLARARCPAGTTKLGVLPDGSVYPCNLLFGRPGFLLGNILTDSFDDIWHHPSLAFFHSFEKNHCPDRDCALHAACHGGCPAQSLLLTGDLAAPDPRCTMKG